MACLVKTLFGDEGGTQKISVLFILITFKFKAISQEHEIWNAYIVYLRGMS